MDYLIQGGQLLLSISILVVLHELGHFLAAKYFKTKVESFYLFFNPWFSIWKKKIGETTYGIGWLPLGGYVKIAGMIDESMDKEQMAQPPQPWEFRSKPTWQRLIIMLGGIIVNVILGFLIYSLVLFAYGEKYLPASELTNGVWVTNDALGSAIGIQSGDQIVKINGTAPTTFTAMQEEIFYAQTLTVNRDGKEITLKVPENLIETLVENERSPLFMPRIPFTVGGIGKGYAAEKAGFEEQDMIVGVNDIPVNYYDEFKGVVSQFTGQKITVKVKREGAIVDVPIVVPDSNILGLRPYGYSISDLEKTGLYHLETKEYSFFEAFPGGFNKAREKLVNYYKQFKIMLNPSTGAYKGMGGFVSISKLFGTEWIWQNFWEKTAWISLVLAFMNLLPIPALDGGHVMFLLYEMITRRKPNEKAMEYAQFAGMILLLAFMLYANTDFLRL
ncbi:MAG: RIP metalloprotease RseP [Flavobacteriales bacterium]|nr:RIP metalloprotease RseP [Flavobacteriales bacterium]